ncbi:glycoside hydrolase superfamily [Armillaria mellea]|nr:glycoside hydrolase superfamily [Armillaria mellea]
MSKSYVTPEISMKWDATESTQGMFTITGSDYLVNWAISKSKQIRGHTLVPDSQESKPSVYDITTPVNSTLYVFLLLSADYRPGLTTYLQIVGYLQVLNEDGTLRSSGFYNVLGESFITIAFKAARAADPTAKLYINDYKMVAPVERINADEQANRRYQYSDAFIRRLERGSRNSDGARFGHRRSKRVRLYYRR